MRWIETVRRRFSSLPLGAKLAWLSAGLSALFVAAASRYRTSIVTGTDLSSLRAVHVALDPDVPSDTGVYGVIDMTAGTYSVAAVPLVSANRTLGAILLGQRIDAAYLAAITRMFD